MNFFLKYKLIIIVIIMLATAGTAIFVYQKEKKEFKQESIEVSEKKETNFPEQEKLIEEQRQAEADQTPKEIPPTTDNTGLAAIADVSVTAYKSQDEGLSAYFYVPSGVYTIQKKNGATWIDLISNKYYPGHGGLAAAPINKGEQSVPLRIIKIESGKAVSISKNFFINESELVGGLKTYN